MNSTVCFNNCTFSKKYGASYLFEQTLETDNSSKILFNNKNIGTSTDRDNYIPLSKGSTWFDTNLNNLILWNGTNWINMDGNPADAMKQGTTEQRPLNIQIGYIYKDTTLNKLILWEGTKWVNLDGTELAQ